MLSIKLTPDDEPDEIKCIFFSEFHPTAGPKIVYQVPADYISKEEFDTTHIFIITKPELVNRTITINALGHKIVGCPVCIDNPKYARNALIFNLCFVFDANANTIYHEPVVTKLANYLTTLESESGLLSKEEYKVRLPDILASILEELNLLGTCCVQVGVDFLTSIQLKIVPPHSQPPMILGHQVPILNICNDILPLGQWDLATQQILTYIDGFKHVARIAAEADVEINIVKTCIQNLVYHDAVKLISIFQYSNVYLTTPNIKLIIENEELREECVSYVSKPFSAAGRLPTFKNIFRLYCGFKAGTTVRDLCGRFNPHNLHVDERKLIQYGLMKGLIRRLEKYPIRLPHVGGDGRPIREGSATRASHEGAASRTTHEGRLVRQSHDPVASRLKHVYRWLNGRHSFDEICCKTGISYQDLEEKIDNDPGIVVCWK